MTVIIRLCIADDWIMSSLPHVFRHRLCKGAKRTSPAMQSTGVGYAETAGRRALVGGLARAEETAEGFQAGGGVVLGRPLVEGAALGEVVAAWRAGRCSLG